MIRTKPRALAVAAALLLLLAACGEAETPRLAPLPEGALVLAFGNSLTHGTGAAPEESYPAQLQDMIGRRVIARGRPGELSAGGLARFEGVLDQIRPDLVILCHGGNDILRRRDLGKTAENLRAMIRLARDKGAQVVLIGVPEPGLLGIETADFYGQVADELDVPYEGTALAEILGDDNLKSDPIHPQRRRLPRARPSGRRAAAGAWRDHQSGRLLKSVKGSGEGGGLSASSPSGIAAGLSRSPQSVRPAMTSLVASGMKSSPARICQPPPRAL